MKDGEGCPQCKGALRVSNAIELGHIFKLGTKYSSAMGAKVLDADGKEHPIVMGSYGIGIGRILACAIELGCDENGISWPSTLAPYIVVLIGVNLRDEKVAGKAEEIYQTLQSQGIDVLYDDRDVSPGIKFKDADLLGMPYQVLVSPKSLAAGGVEIKSRSTGQRSIVNVDEFLAFLRGNDGREK
ncbi:MAG TPA: hypothetical protein ENF16_03200 [Bacteroidetes bacterium]|nr:hypothetical protein [Bacteroidota bacterium]